MSTENWRPVVNATDYLGGQKKRVEIEQRRPTIRKAADLVGPGIGPEAVRITDYNNLLATFNGYYSSAAGALNAPNATEAFVGQVISDAEFGGRQVFTGLTSGTEYVRTFTRSPTDAETIGWGLWSGQRVPPSAAGYDVVQTPSPAGRVTILPPPNLHYIGESGVYEPSAAGIRIRRQGVYTGMMQVGSSSNNPADVYIQRPDGNTTQNIGQVAQLLGPTRYYPFTVWATDDQQGFAVSVYQTAGGAPNFWWRFTCTRLGDAI